MATAYDRELNLEQLDVVLHGDGPCLVLAGAGSGKTRTIVYRVAYLLEQGVLPQQILLLTFTNKAANEMLSRVEQLLRRTPRGLWGGTFHHVANRILRRYASAIGYQSNFTILDEEDSLDLLKLCVKDVGVATSERRFPVPAVLKSVISLSRNSQRDLEEVVADRHPKFMRIASEISAVAQRYDERKRRANSMDFDDLLLNLLRVLEQPDPHRALSSQFRYVLVDEYQDTNRIQAAIVSRLASVHGNVLVVGDDAQSIYSFRAADVGNILRFPEAFPGTKTFRIETNYRSTPQILKVANAAIAENEQQFEKTLRPIAGNGGRPQLVQSHTLEDEARWVAKRILELRDDGVPLSEIAVLFRATHLSEFLEMELVKRDIPYDYRGGIRFFERAHIKDVLAFLKVLTNPHDEAAWLRVLRMQHGIGDVGAMEAIQRIQELLVSLRGGAADEAIPRNTEVEIATFAFGSLAMTTFRDRENALDLSPRLQAGWRSFLKMAKPLTASAEPAALIRALAKGSYHDYLESEYPNWEERLDDLEQLALFAEKYTEVAAFLADTSLQELFGAERVGTNASEQERIVLSTIHQAKGLEWRAVFVIGLTAAAFPNRRALLEEGGVEEERRLFYVAITRAKERLALSYALSGGVESSYLHAPSPFLSEIPPHLLEPIGVARVPHRPWRDRDDDGEPIVVLDAMGERNPMGQAAHPRKGFLRDVEEL